MSLVFIAQYISFAFSAPIALVVCYRAYNQRDHEQNTSIVWLSAGTLLIFLGQGMALLAAYFIWIHIAVSITVYSGLLFMYWSLRNLLYLEPTKEILTKRIIFKQHTAVKGHSSEQNEVLTKSTVFKIFSILTSITLILNIGRIITWIPTDKESSLHYPIELDIWPPFYWQFNTAFYFMHDLIQFIFLVLIIGTYIHSIFSHRKNIAYLARRIICCTGFLIASIGLGAILTRIILYSLGHDEQNLILIRTYQDTKSLSIIILPIGFLIPHRILVWLTSPIDYARKYQRKQQTELIKYLHSKIILIIPSVQLNPNLLSESRMLIEISDARQYIWSYIERQEPTTPQEEAQRIFDLLNGNMEIEKYGPYIPPNIGNSSVFQHHLAVAKCLKQLENGR